MYDYTYSYAYEKFNSAIHTLAVLDGDVRSRLMVAFEGSLLCIDVNKLPIDAIPKWVKAHKMATKYNERYKGEEANFREYKGTWERLRPSPYEATFRRIKNSTGREIAELIFSVWSIIQVDFFSFCESKYIKE
ncbi:hypothetical protein H4684_003597 [Desulfomicrobium macestii]|uniref:Uncharacterized protein n=1 Tax=Desulfomicrobium macestii TaxID=90731 RepID=A0ABR9H896_9BACT|nr:hypothetical protein [Desulfomicrobium macestii]MBE1426915.1 hypothetical protein [Desulfomicrobium macestii]